VSWSWTSADRGTPQRALCSVWFLGNIRT